MHNLNVLELSPGRQRVHSESELVDQVLYEMSPKPAEPANKQKSSNTMVTFKLGSRCILPFYWNNWNIGDSILTPITSMRNGRIPLVAPECCDWSLHPVTAHSIGYNHVVVQANQEHPLQ